MLRCRCGKVFGATRQAVELGANRQCHHFRIEQNALESPRGRANDEGLLFELEGLVLVVEGELVPRDGFSGFEHVAVHARLVEGTNARALQQTLLNVELRDEFGPLWAHLGDRAEVRFALPFDAFGEGNGFEFSDDIGVERRHAL